MERTDGTILRFTSHDQELEVDEDGDVDTETFVPAGGFNGTAIQREAGLQVQNLDLLGVLSSSYVTEDDLRAGMYRNAQVTRLLVDWRISWAGVIETQTFWIGDVKYNGELWVAELSSQPMWLHQKVGRVHSRICDIRDHGNARCGFDNTTSPYTVLSVPVDDGTQDADEPRRIFQGTVGGIPSSDNGVDVVDDFYKHGKVVWSTGANADAGIVSEIKEYTHATRLIELTLPTPFAIDDTDVFTIIVGCDRLPGTCKDKFDNRINFKGFEYMPGSDKVLRTP